MKGVDKAELIGNLGKDPEVSTLEGGITHETLSRISKPKNRI
jgi:hypothetical protein